MRGVYGFYAFGRGNQHKGFDVAAAFLFEQVNRGNHRAACCQHGVNNQRGTFVHFVHQFFKIRHGLQGFFVALQADYADFCARNQV